VKKDGGEKRRGRKKATIKNAPLSGCAGAQSAKERKVEG